MLKRNATSNSPSLYFHSKIPLTLPFSNSPPLAVTVDFISKALYLQKRIFTFQLISQEKHKLPLLGTVSRPIFTIIMEVPAGEEPEVTVDIILNEKNMHNVFNSYCIQEKIGNVFLKYSQKADNCFSCGRILFTNIFLPKNTHLPVFIFIYQQKIFIKEFQVTLGVCLWLLGGLGA